MRSARLQCVSVKPLHNRMHVNRLRWAVELHSAYKHLAKVCWCMGISGSQAPWMPTLKVCLLYLFVSVALLMSAASESQCIADSERSRGECAQAREHTSPSLKRGWGSFQVLHHFPIPLLI